MAARTVNGVTVFVSAVFLLIVLNGCRLLVRFGIEELKQWFTQN